MTFEIRWCWCWMDLGPPEVWSTPRSLINSSSSISRISFAFESPWSFTFCWRWGKAVAKKVDLGNLANICLCCLSNFKVLTWGKWQKVHSSANLHFPDMKLIQGRWHNSGCPKLPQLTGDPAGGPEGSSTWFFVTFSSTTLEVERCCRIWSSCWHLTSNSAICTIISASDNFAPFRESSKLGQLEDRWSWGLLVTSSTSTTSMKVLR